MDDEKQSFRKAHPDFDFFFNKVAWAAITTVVSFAAIQLNKLSDNVAELNKNMTLVVFQLGAVEKAGDQFRRDLDALVERVNELERKR
jgi:hypothetical protein